MKRAFDTVDNSPLDIATPSLSAPLATYDGPSFSDGVSLPGAASFDVPSYNTALTTTRQSFVTSRLEHDSTNSPIAQRECLFSLPSRSESGRETLYSPRTFNIEYNDVVLSLAKLRKLRDELLFQGISLGSTTSVDMDMQKPTSRLPWNTGAPLIDVVISGRTAVLDSWPKASASDRLYFILVPYLYKSGASQASPQTQQPSSGNSGAPLEKKQGGDLYKVRLEPHTFALNDPSVSDTACAREQPWVRGKFYCVGTIADPKPVPAPDLSGNTYKPEATLRDEMMVRDRVVNICRMPFLC